MNYAELLDYSDSQFCHIAELNKTNKKLEKRIAELEVDVRKSNIIHTAQNGAIDRLNARIAELEKPKEFIPLTPDWVYVKEDDIERMVKRIAELEKEVKGYQVALSLPSNSEAHNLEQQAKGVEDFADLTLFPSMGDGVSAEYCKGFEKALSIALSQARYLKNHAKEQGE